jgi:hypothetical protein
LVAPPPGVVVVAEPEGVVTVFVEEPGTVVVVFVFVWVLGPGTGTGVVECSIVVLLLGG